MNIINNNIELPVLNYEGNQIDTVKLAEWVFGVEAHEDAVQLAVKVDLANRRQATAKTKTRSEVSGGGKKPWRQKVQVEQELVLPDLHYGDMVVQSLAQPELKTTSLR